MKLKISSKLYLRKNLRTLKLHPSTATTVTKNRHRVSHEITPSPERDRLATSSLEKCFYHCPCYPGALARPLIEDHGMSSYEEYFESLKEGEEAMSEAEYNECLSPLA